MKQAHEAQKHGQAQLVGNTQSVEDRSSLTFEKYTHSQKHFSDATVINLLNDDLMFPDGRRTVIKGFLDRLPADQSDIEFTQSPDTIAYIRAQLNTFLARRINIYAPDDTSAYNAAISSVSSLRKGLFVSNKIYTEHLEAVYGGIVERYDTEIMRHRGPIVNYNGKLYDLYFSKVAGVLANIYNQDNIFLHYSSKKYIVKKERDTRPKLTRRIYLNPKIEDMVGVFEQVIVAAESAGLSIKAKILDRSNEALMNRNSPNRTLRGDGIVLYVGEDADSLLQIVEDVYMKNHRSFVGRKTSRIPLRIADGIAIGDEPVAENESLTSHRAELLGNVRREVLSRLGGDAWQLVPHDKQRLAVDLFREVYRAMAIQEKVNPDNIAFNLH